MRIEKIHSSTISYPCLGETKNGHIVLFVADAEGVCIWSKDTDDIGIYGMNWGPCIPYNGNIKISNEYINKIVTVETTIVLDGE